MSEYESNFTETNDNNCSNKCNLDVRTEFIIIEDSEDICCLLKKLGKKNINIDGFALQNVGDNCIFRFVVGNANCQSSNELNEVRCILNKLDICYLENDILKVILPLQCSTTLARIYCALQEFVDVDAIYKANSYGIYIDVSCIEMANKIISNLL